MSRHDYIDLLKLYSSGSHKGWNEVLDQCFKTKNINRLARIRYGIQAGMDKLAKEKLNDEKLNIFFIRLNRSLEQTARAIIRNKHPLPGDNPLIAKEHDKKFLEVKRKRDRELAAFFKKSAY